jgi:hypothetical protein
MISPIFLAPIIENDNIGPGTKYHTLKTNIYLEIVEAKDGE